MQNPERRWLSQLPVSLGSGAPDNFFANITRSRSTTFANSRGDTFEELA